MIRFKAIGIVITLFFQISLLFLIQFGVKAQAVEKGIFTHDPSTIHFENGKYYCFSTGNGIQVISSIDLKDWKLEKPVFEKEKFPKWILEHIPTFKGHFWAPDILKINGYYYLYYSCSSFGSAISAIGLARSKTLSTESENQAWEDLGMVVKSEKRTDFNAIDPGLFKDSDNKIYLTYGSYHEGIALVEIDSVSGKTKGEIKKIAGGKGSDWEAPYIIKDKGEYFLFANNGSCCKGVNSTYRVVVGKSSSIFGPYFDKNERNLSEGGGSTVLATDKKIIGPGHVALLVKDNKKIVSTHFYDPNNNGKATLLLWNLSFKKGWPIFN